MDLVLDFGNTLYKAALFDQHEKMLVCHKYESAKLLLDDLSDDKYKNVILSSVSGYEEDVKNHFDNTLVINAQTPLPFKNTYTSPQTLGVDRICLVAGVQKIFPNTACLIISLGTCITYDYIDQHNTYHGGAISPGMNMRFKALNHFTKALPLLEYRDQVIEIVGVDTKSSIYSGIINGIVEEINGFVARYRDINKEIKVILAGGDAKSFDTKLKAPIFVEQNLALIGLHAILKYNIRINQ